MEELMEFINYHSKLASIKLAEERGPMPYYDKSFYPEGKLPFKGFYEKGSWHQDWDKVVDLMKQHGIRNGYTTIIAPTGSISMIAGCSSGIEPAYSLVFEKHVKVGDFYYINQVFANVMANEGLLGDDLLRDISNHSGSIQNISYIPRNIKQRFITAVDMRPEDHIRALASFQKWVDSSISKTINFPANATVEDMRTAYLLAYKLGCKDVTVFRDTSIPEQVLSTPTRKDEASDPLRVDDEPPVSSGSRLSGNRGENHVKACPQCAMPLVYQEGCYSCLDCGWGACA
jgi:ribonucleoside-diphosphate reductase alpha chain